MKYLLASAEVAELKTAHSSCEDSAGSRSDSRVVLLGKAWTAVARSGAFLLDEGMVWSYRRV
jgi:hypothetical protein